MGGAQLRISHAERMPPETGKSTPPKKPAPGVKGDKFKAKPGHKGPKGY